MISLRWQERLQQFQNWLADSWQLQVSQHTLSTLLESFESNANKS